MRCPLDSYPLSASIYAIMMLTPGRCRLALKEFGDDSVPATGSKKAVRPIGRSQSSPKGEKRRADRHSGDDSVPAIGSNCERGQTPASPTIKRIRWSVPVCPPVRHSRAYSVFSRVPMMVSSNISIGNEKIRIAQSTKRWGGWRGRPLPPGIWRSRGHGQRNRANWAGEHVSD